MLVNTAFDKKYRVEIRCKLNKRVYFIFRTNLEAVINIYVKIKVINNNLELKQSCYLKNEFNLQLKSLFPN